jgi:hypothetical protein
MRSGALILLTWLAAAGIAGPAAAEQPVLDAANTPPPAASEPATAERAAEHLGRPAVKLDRLDFPEHVSHRTAYVAFLKKVLRREAARADWGAGYGARIEYRFSVTDLNLVEHAEVLTVTCAATGKLPKGKTARSRISFGGDPHKPRDAVQRVLQIVARGVITRLAELERARRNGSP